MLDSLQQAVRVSRQRSEERRANPQDVWGLAVGMESIDHLTGGYQPKTFNAIGAFTSHGKTALGIQWVFNVAQNLYYQTLETGEHAGIVYFCTPEMPAEDIVERRASQMTGIHSHLINRGKASDDEFSLWEQAHDDISALSTHIVLDAERAVDVIDLREQVNILHRQTPVVFLVVDYVQYLTAGTARGAYDVSTRVAEELKGIAQDIGGVVLGFSQLNKEINKRNRDEKEESPPTMADMRGSGRLYEIADTVGLLWRPPQVQGHGHRTKQVATLNFEKNRRGPVGAIPLHYEPQFTLFHDLGVDVIKLDGGTDE